ncbi:MAG TPA: hypothetical protein VMW87_00140 [Spirochaetia bacterium]|nr:hypothetical protein [Spirochaetia bacterium]
MLWDYVAGFDRVLADVDRRTLPWAILARAAEIVAGMIHSSQYGSDSGFNVRDGVAVHSTAQIEPGVVIRGPAILMPGCSVGPNALLREGVYVGANARVGSSCEVKSSLLFSGSVLAHLNYVGNSIIGNEVNIEAGAVIANHFNERTEREVAVVAFGTVMKTGVFKFGALVGDRSRIGANAVTTPGTILPPGSVVARLALVDQVADLAGV